MEKEKKYFAGWFFWILLIMIVAGIVLTSLNYVGLIGKTVVERKVFENSFQYSEARKSAVAGYQAQLVEIDRKLMSPTLNTQTRTTLEAQASGLRILLSTERSKQ